MREDGKELGEVEEKEAKEGKVREEERKVEEEERKVEEEERKVEEEVEVDDSNENENI